MRKRVPFLAVLALSTSACQTWVTGAENTPSGPYVRAGRTVFEIPAETLERSIAASDRHVVAGSPFSVATVTPEVFGKLMSGGPRVLDGAQLGSIGWPGSSDLWSYGGTADGSVRVGARVLGDKSLHLHIGGEVDTGRGSAESPRGSIVYDGSCGSRSVFVFTCPLQDRRGVYVVAYEITELSSVRQPSATWSVRCD